MNYYNEIKEKLVDNEIYSKVKDYSKERHKVITYFEIGKLLNDAGGKYGDNIIDEYSKKLVVEVGKKYNRRTLFRMKQFYSMFSDGKVSQLATQLSWSHYVELLPLKNIDEISYYINICRQQNIGRDLLREKIRNNEYNRLPIETKNKLILDDKIEVKDLVPNPILIRNKNNIKIFNEKALHNLILEDIESFMRELGNSFSFIGSEYKIKIGDRNHYIDLLLFNIKFNCYVVIELKVTQFKVEYISQVQKYMNYIDKNIKEISNNNTMGILICKRENKFVIEYCSDERIAIREYQLVWSNTYRGDIMDNDVLSAEVCTRLSADINLCAFSGNKELEYGAFLYGKEKKPNIIYFDIPSKHDDYEPSFRKIEVNTDKNGNELKFLNTC